MSFLCNSLLAIMFKCVEPGFSFKSPSNILIVGPTSCGKTTFLHHLLLENLDLFDERPPRVHYCYGSWQNKFDDMQRHGVPDICLPSADTRLPSCSCLMKTPFSCGLYENFCTRETNSREIHTQCLCGYQNHRHGMLRPCGYQLLPTITNMLDTWAV